MSFSHFPSLHVWQRDLLSYPHSRLLLTLPHNLIPSSSQPLSLNQFSLLQSSLMGLLLSIPTANSSSSPLPHLDTAPAPAHLTDPSCLLSCCCEEENLILTLSGFSPSRTSCGSQDKPVSPLCLLQTPPEEALSASPAPSVSLPHSPISWLQSNGATLNNLNTAT